MGDLAQMFNRVTASSSLSERFAALIEAEPSLRRRQQAERLDVPEAQLIDQQCGVQSIRLNRKFSDLIYALPELGYIMSLTRNESAVHERKGIYDNIRINGPMGLVISPDRKIDLRIILSRWTVGYAVCEALGDSHRFSLQFFDQAGNAIQKIYLQPNSNFAAYQRLVEQFGAADQDAQMSFSTPEANTEMASDSDVDTHALVNEWKKMTDVHQFFGLLRRHKVTREQAFRLVGEPYACPVANNSVGYLLEEAAQQRLPIMCFVGNSGNIQIHSGVIETVKRVGPWLNVLDPEFNLHLLEDQVASAWLIRKPTVDGMVTSLELYDAKGETIAQFFGVREEGQPENRAWRALVESLLGEEVAA
ncbi:hemin-degrading factor [Neptunomonas marina]|uniref:Hemin-degrading factor n=1 Tax=Neptunomonas marina TaxID=1815562 RepID=A0A437Q4Z9_9GAMM|nr:ChuX/HutX family heme-like substrate-binding protein [Neptunomonas marina]RVU29572.1 hemin-degrading factor [Neptunomonas marina]